MSPLPKGLRVSLWVLAAVALLVGGLEVSDRVLPHEFAFGTEDLEARTQYEKIVAAHGYTYRYDKNVHGETLVVIDRITPGEYKKIDCAFFAWNAKRERSRGTIVYDRADCAL